MGIKTKFLVSHRHGLINIDDLINDFVKEKHNVELIDIEIIDIKYQTVAHKEYGIRTSALVIYKEKQAFQRWWLQGEIK